MGSLLPATAGRPSHLRDFFDASCKDAESEPDLRTPVVTHTIFPSSSTTTDLGGVLVRIPGALAGAIPAVPAGIVVISASVDGEIDDAVTGDLTRLGYIVVGTHPRRGPGPHPAVDLLVPPRAQLACPVWFQDLTTLSSRAFSLDHGPVRLVLADELALHARRGRSRLRH